MHLFVVLACMTHFAGAATQCWSWSYTLGGEVTFDNATNTTVGANRQTWSQGDCTPSTGASSWVVCYDKKSNTGPPPDVSGSEPTCTTASDGTTQCAPSYVGTLQLCRTLRWAGPNSSCSGGACDQTELYALVGVVGLLLLCCCCFCCCMEQQKTETEK